MYRLADKVGLDDLKRSAFKAIKDNLAPSNIVHEVFCQFTSLYPDVQKLTTGYLCDNYRKPEVVRDLPVAVRRVAAGELEHAGDVIMSLMNQLASRGPV
ncbi:hypothetical protein JAAARDRAFT_35386 [Jaapia argillacea MUCL 33604]|uniref:Uncharacterized protein n=1 Tax=Jaapia argillacea MUCL 33604 TaxID=933084 RepID=A0A067Q2I4_9AGAM|nr:hypothetical protein JAAARDRAFT_35386 [Jaapia argillacea MUCL 33604]